MRILFRNSSANTAAVCIVIFFVVFITHVISKITISIDSKWSIHTALSIVREGNTNLDEYMQLMKKKQYFAIEFVNGHYYTRYPIGASLIALPFVYLTDRLLAKGFMINLRDIINEETPGGFESCIASFVLGIASVFLYLLLRSCNTSFWQALALVFVLAFCTSAWSVASRALWQHGPTLCLLTIAMYLIVLARKRTAHEGVFARLLSLPLFFSFLVRPTNLFMIMLFSLYMILNHRRHIVAFLIWGSIVLIPLFIYNITIYDALLSPYYTPQRQYEEGTHLLEGLAGTLISPARGLFIFSPVLLFSFVGIGIKIKQKAMNSFDYTLILLAVFHWLSVSSFPIWWAGHSIGARYFTDILPIFIYFLIPITQYLHKPRSALQIVCLSLFALTLVASFFIHWNCANNLGPSLWNVEPVNVEHDPSRVWDWHDLQFLRHLKEPQP